MSLLNLSVVEMTQQTEPIKGWVYRILINDQGCILMRCPSDSLLWSHGVIKQIYQPDEKEFVPACNSAVIARIKLAEAIGVIDSQ